MTYEFLDMQIFLNFMYAIGRTKTFHLSTKRKIYLCKLSRKEQFHHKKFLQFHQNRELQQGSEICICGVYIHCNHDTLKNTYIFMNIDISNNDNPTLRYTLLYQIFFKIKLN